MRERRLLALFPTDGTPVTADWLLGRYYVADEAKPFNAREVINGRLRGIARKADALKADFRLCKTPRRGPNFIQYWLEER